MTEQQIQEFVSEMEDSLNQHICNVGARVAREKFGAEMYQFPDYEPTQSLIPHGKGTGHVFAILDDRYLIDFWAWKKGLIPNSVLDMDDPEMEPHKKKYGYNWEYIPK